MDYENTDPYIPVTDSESSDNFLNSRDINPNDFPVKSYIRDLHKKTEFDECLRRWVEKEIMNVNRRIHKVGTDTIAALLIQGNIELQTNYGTDYILQVMGLTKHSDKRRVLALSQGQNEGSIPACSSVFIPLIVTHPTVFIREIVDAFVKRKGLDSDAAYSLNRDIMHFVKEIYTVDAHLSTYDPKCCACALVYCYTTFVYGKGSKPAMSITKVEFKDMTFTTGKMANLKDFDACLKIINKTFDEFRSQADDELLARLLYSQETLDEFTADV
jgi:hypothetical protein